MDMSPRSRSSAAVSPAGLSVGSDSSRAAAAAAERSCCLLLRLCRLPEAVLPTGTGEVPSAAASQPARAGTALLWRFCCLAWGCVCCCVLSGMSAALAGVCWGERASCPCCVWGMCWWCVWGMCCAVSTSMLSAQQCTCAGRQQHQTAERQQANYMPLYCQLALHPHCIHVACLQATPCKICASEVCLTRCISCTNLAAISNSEACDSCGHLPAEHQGASAA